MNDPHVFFIPHEPGPGRIEIAPYWGHGADQISLRVELYP